MNKIIGTLMIVGLILIVFGTTIFMGGEYLNWQREKFQAEMQWEKQKLELEMKRVCQELDAETYKKDWGYGSCIKELKLDKTTEKLL